MCHQRYVPLVLVIWTGLYGFVPSNGQDQPPNAKPGPQKAKPRLEFRLAIHYEKNGAEASQARSLVTSVRTGRELEAAKVPGKCEWLEFSEGQALQLGFLQKTNEGVTNRDETLTGFRKDLVHALACFHIPREKRHYVLAHVPEPAQKVTEFDLSDLQVHTRTETPAITLRLKPSAEDRFSELTKSGQGSTLILVFDKKVVFLAYLTEPLRSEIMISFGGLTRAEREQQMRDFRLMLKDVLPKPRNGE